jgi:tRNA A-37 threonylcarbamoyl transferase component Bud32
MLSSMTSTADINTFAEAIIKEHGNDAAAVCKERANKFYDRGNNDQSMLWTRIAMAVEDLQRPETDFGEDVQ